MRSTPSLSLITPTLGRSTLRKLCVQFLYQASDADEFLIVADGERPAAAELVTDFDDPRLRYFTTPPTGHWGSEQCTLGIEQARGDYLIFIGDDDELADDALPTIRSIVSLSDPHPYLFAMNYAGTIFQNSLACGNCSGQQLVVPRLPSSRVPAYPLAEQVNDWQFMSETVALWDGRFEPRPEVIAVLYGRSHGKVF